VIALERKLALDETIEASDAFWAGVDVAIVFSTVKALRALRVGGAGGAAARAGTRAGTASGAVGAAGGRSLVQRTQLLGVRMVPRGALGRAIVKGGAAALIVYVVVRHPSVLHGVFDAFAELLGWNPFVVRALGWALVVGVALAVATALAGPLVALLVTVATGALRALRRLGRLVRP
jgi:hypothetical protein